jgi:hypothetical protein
MSRLLVLQDLANGETTDFDSGSCVIEEQQLLMSRLADEQPRMQLRSLPHNQDLRRHPSENHETHQRKALEP